MTKVIDAFVNFAKAPNNGSIPVRTWYVHSPLDTSSVRTVCLSLNTSVCTVQRHIHFLTSTALSSRHFTLVPFRQKSVCAKQCILPSWTRQTFLATPRTRVEDRPARSSVTIATELPGPPNGLWSWLCLCQLITNFGSLLHIFVPRGILFHDINVPFKTNGAPPGIRMSFSFLLFSGPGTKVCMICGQE